VSSQREFLRDMAAILVSKAGFASDSPDVQRLRRMAEQPSLGLRLTRMANTASTVADELNEPVFQHFLTSLIPRRLLLGSELIKSAAQPRQS